MRSLFRKTAQFIRSNFRKITGIDELAMLSRNTLNIIAYMAWREVLKDTKYSDPRVLSRYGFKVYSQAEEDGIIHEIFRRIGVTRKTFIEIGVSTGLECNTLYLLRQGWRGVWIDADKQCAEKIRQMFNSFLCEGSLRYSCKVVTPENINQLYLRYLPEQGLDFLSIDIDGNDFHVLAAIQGLDANVITLEYNPIFVPPLEWIMEYDEEHKWMGTDNYGASLKSYEKMLSKKGYALVGCTTNGNNAFFVRRDLAKDYFHDDCSAEFHYEPQRFWITKAFMSGHSCGFSDK